MGQSPEIGGGSQPSQKRVESAVSKIKAIKTASGKALDRLLPQGPRLATDTVGFTAGKAEAPSDPKQKNIQRTQIEDRPKSRVQTQTKPAETFEEARRRRFQEEQEIAGGPTQKDIAGANAGKLRPNRLVKFIQENKALTAAVGVGTAAAGVGAVAIGVNSMLDNRIEAHQSIDNSQEPSKAAKTEDIINDVVSEDAVPAIEIPEVTIPTSFTTIEKKGKGKESIIAEGTILEGVNTTRLTEENIESIIKNNPDSYSPENWDPHVMTNKHIFIAVESDKPVVVERSTGIVEAYIVEDDGSQTPIRYAGAGATSLTFQGTGVLKLFTPNPAEVFQRPPFIVNGEQYINNFFFVVETLPDGGKVFYTVDLEGNSLTGKDYSRADAWKFSDEFKNAPQATQLNSDERKTSIIPDILYDAKNGIKAEMKVDENGNIISPALVEILTPGTKVSIGAMGNIDLIPYLTEENGDTKVAKPY